jgi:hypothetical protein
MIKENDRFHGAALGLIVDGWGGPLQIRRIVAAGGGAYEINNRSVIYFKYSTARLSPWSFTFHPEHWEALGKLKGVYDTCVVGFVCNQDGVAALNFDELEAIKPTRPQRALGVAIRREPRHHYSISCGRTDLPYKISRDELVDKLKGLRHQLRLDPTLPWPLPIQK